MVDTLVSGASASRRVGSTPIMRTGKRPAIVGLFSCADRSRTRFQFQIAPEFCLSGIFIIFTENNVLSYENGIS